MIRHHSHNRYKLQWESPRSSVGLCPPASTQSHLLTVTIISDFTTIGPPFLSFLFWVKMEAEVGMTIHSYSGVAHCAAPVRATCQCIGGGLLLLADCPSRQCVWCVLRVLCCIHIVPSLGCFVSLDVTVVHAMPNSHRAAQVPSRHPSKVIVAWCTEPLGQAQLLANIQYNTWRHLRSADTSTLLVPTTRRSTLGDCTFPAAAARAWNSLPCHVRTCLD